MPGHSQVLIANSFIGNDVEMWLASSLIGSQSHIEAFSLIREREKKEFRMERDLVLVFKYLKLKHNVIQYTGQKSEITDTIFTKNDYLSYHLDHHF